MFKLLSKVLKIIRSRFRITSNLLAQSLVLRQQMLIMKPRNKRLKLKSIDRIFWVILSRFWKPWQTFLSNHAHKCSIDFFVVPAVTFKILFVFIVLRHSNREIVHLNITANPTAQWTAQQVVEAFPENSVPKYLMRDRDSIYGSFFRNRVKNMGINEVISAPKSPWQNPFVERVIGSIRRECTDHVIV